MMQNELYEEVIIAGYGGQGIILIGKLLTYAAMKNDLEVTYMPAYGVEVRGGAANCMVVLANTPVASPVVTEPSTLITMNNPSFASFVPRVRPHGTVVLNSSLIHDVSLGKQVSLVAVPAEELALQAGNIQCANMVMLGAYLQCRSLLSVEKVAACLPAILAKRHHNTIPINEKALHLGAEHVRKTQP